MQFFAPSCDVVFRKTKSPFPHWCARLLAVGSWPGNRNQRFYTQVTLSIGSRRGGSLIAATKRPSPFFFFNQMEGATTVDRSLATQVIKTHWSRYSRHKQKITSRASVPESDVHEICHARYPGRGNVGHFGLTRGPKATQLLAISTNVSLDDAFRLDDDS